MRIGKKYPVEKAATPVVASSMKQQQQNNNPGEIPTHICKVHLDMLQWWEQQVLFDGTLKAIGYFKFMNDLYESYNVNIWDYKINIIDGAIESRASLSKKRK
jgi:hypothetical protein